MKFLVAIALLTLAVAGATHVKDHTLRGPRFKAGKQYNYNLDFNMTAGVLGLSSQVSAAVLRAEVSIYAKTDREHILKIENVYTSGSVKAIDHKYGDIPMHKDRDYEDRLSTPIKFTLENGKVVSYTLSKRESLESKKIKKSILRSLEMYISESALTELESQKIHAPVTYNTTEVTEYGVHSTHYLITVSPYVDFPYEKMVYNVSRIENFEGESYPGYHVHHNFQKQGCPEVCRKEWSENEYGAGCPSGHEPHQSPIKTTMSHEHALSVYEHVLSPEVIRTVEVHVAEMYDQDMEVLIRYELKRTGVSSESIKEQSGQPTYTDLHDMESEINEEEIAELCYSKKTDEYVAAAKNLLKTIARTIVQGELSQSNSYQLGEKAILLRDALEKLLESDFKKLAAEIKSIDNLEFATDEEKVKRQIWMDVLPLVGTQESVKFIVEYITRGIREKDILIWEAKEILEALPQNIVKADSETISELRKLTKNTELLRKSTLLHSAIHLTMGRVIGEVCGTVPIVRSQPVQKAASWFGQLRQTPESTHRPVMCPESLVNEIVEEMTRKLKGTSQPSEIAIYLETLSHIGTEEVLPVISEYVYGTAENIQRFSPRFIDFTRTVAQYALHNIAGKHPEEVLEIVMPVFFNETETPKVRNAAFGVLIRCQPSMAILEKVVIRSWFERSNEVGSFVTSTMETFGNSTLPCMQLTSHRITTVLPQMRRFDVGMQHAKNNMWTYFDDHRDFGMEGRFEYTPNNESFIPSTLYKSLSYSISSLRDIVWQSAHNIEGLTQEMILKKIIEYLNIESIETIEKEGEVFGEGKAGLKHIHPRMVEDLRFTTYHKLFYKNSYYYFDSSNIESARKEMFEYLTAYLKKTENKNTGYLVKMMLPSSYHTMAIAKTIPYPVEFQMRQPVILALNIESLPNPARLIKEFHTSIRPSVYLSKMFTHQMKNLGDCKEVGVYHEHKIAINYPFELKYDGKHFPNMTIRYKVPPKSKRILSYHTEAGTYVGKKRLEMLPLNMEKQPIRIIPSPFKFERNLNIVGVPPLHVELHTEDMNLLAMKLPRNPVEALDLAIRRILNAGWRYKSVNVTVLEDHNLWPGDTEATFKVEYSRQYIAKLAGMMSPQDKWSSEIEEESQSQSEQEEEWTKYLKPTDIQSLSKFTENANAASRILKERLPHISHELKVSVTAEPLKSTAWFRTVMMHTYKKNLYLLHAECAARQTEGKPLYQYSLDHLMGYLSIPDELKYGPNYGKQNAVFLTAINMPKGRPMRQWDQVQIGLMGHLYYESNKNILRNELVDRIDEENWLPETHAECLKDVRDGKPLSVDCIKAIREYSIFNKLNMNIMWNNELPYPFRQFARKADIYLKHYFFEHMDVETQRNPQNGISIRMDYIDKLVDEPVIDMELKKPSETVTLRRLPAGEMLPLSSVYTIYETALLEATNNTYMPTCTLMENYVKTYDLKTFEFHPKNCHYVLSTHCTKRKNFAVILHGTKEIYVHVGTNTIILAPKTGQHYKVKYNGEEHEIVFPVLFHERDEIYVYTEPYVWQQKHIKVVAKKAGITVLYDGKTVKVQVSPRYKGELCGLCSEFDGEEVREFRGMNRCLYKDHIDFANSNMVKRDNDKCKIERLREKRMCEGETDLLKDLSVHQGYEPNVRRNVVVTKGNEVCFSILPVSICRDNDVPSETQYESIGFHCLPKRDVTARKLMNEAKERPLEELENKKVDYVDRVEIPKLC